MNISGYGFVSVSFESAAKRKTSGKNEKLLKQLIAFSRIVIVESPTILPIEIQNKYSMNHLYALHYMLVKTLFLSVM